MWNSVDMKAGKTRRDRAEPAAGLAPTGAQQPPDVVGVSDFGIVGRRVAEHRARRLQRPEGAGVVGNAVGDDPGHGVGGQCQGRIDGATEQRRAVAVAQPGAQRALERRGAVRPRVPRSARRTGPTASGISDRDAARRW